MPIQEKVKVKNKPKFEEVGMASMYLMTHMVCEGGAESFNFFEKLIRNTSFQSSSNLSTIVLTTIKLEIWPNESKVVNRTRC